MKTAAQTAGSQPGLRRELGRWDLTAVGVNQVIGSAVFLMPSTVAALIGGWSWLAYLLVGLASLLVALCIAEVGSRFESTGGPYLYARAAFGEFAAFEVNWMQWVTRVCGHASVVNGIALSLGFYWPSMAVGLGRCAVITGLTLALTAVNLVGVRQSAWVLNALTLVKLLPLGVFIGVGIFFTDFEQMGRLEPVTWEEAATAALLLIFAFGGYEVVPVPAGEASDPRRHIPFALVSTIVLVTVVMTLAQIVSLGTLPNLVESETPLADASNLFMGAAGALLIGVGSVLSMTGNNAGQFLTGPRMLFAFAENGDLPGWFGRIHPAFRTPANAILFHAAVALTLALSGSFVLMAIVSAVARLVTYLGSCTAALVLRSRRYYAVVNPPTFSTPLGPLIPILAILVSMSILVGASKAQLLGGLAALTAGAALYFLNRRLRGRSGHKPAGG